MIIGPLDSKQFEQLKAIFPLFIDADKEWTGPDVVTVECGVSLEKGQFVQLADGTDRLPVAFTLPLDLQAGDLCAVRMTDGTLLAVKRDEAIVYAVEGPPDNGNH